MSEPFYLTEGRGYWPDDEILFWACPKCGQAMKPPPELDRIADKVLAYRPKPKTKAANRRKRRQQYAKRRASE